MALHIGIVAVSGEGAALCYRTIVDEGAELFGRHAHPEVTLDHIPMNRYVELAERGDWEAVGGLMLESGRRCAAAGAGFLICPANTAHEALDLVRARSPLPWLHIAEEVAAVARARGYRRLGILGTRYLMEGATYAAKLEPLGIAHTIPEEAERAEVHRAIFDEMVAGRFEEPARAYHLALIDRLAARGCDAVALACTEIPILLEGTDPSLPVLDSTRILARAALHHARAGVAA